MKNENKKCETRRQAAEKKPDFYNEVATFTEKNAKQRIKWNFQYDMKEGILQ